MDLFELLTAPYDALNWLVDQIFYALTFLYDRYGTPIVFLAALAEATVVIGLFFPGMLMMFLGGAYAVGRGMLLLVFVVAVVGTIIGDLISYALGRWGSGWLERSQLGPTLRMGAALIEGRGKWFIPFYHLHNFTRNVGPFGAGAMRLPLRVWLPLDLLGAMLSNGLYIGAGAIFGTALLTEDGTLNEHPAVRIGLGLIALAWYLLLRRSMARRMADMRRTRMLEVDGVPVGDGAPGGGASEGEPATRR